MNAIEYCIARTHAQLVKKFQERYKECTKEDARSIVFTFKAVSEYRQREDQLAPPKN